MHPVSIYFPLQKASKFLYKSKYYRVIHVFILHIIFLFTLFANHLERLNGLNEIIVRTWNLMKLVNCHSAMYV